MVEILELTPENYEAAVTQDKIILVDAWAAWCGPCRAVAPLIDALADEYKDRFKVAKVDVDESPQVARKHGIRGVPTLAVIKDGSVVDQVVGAVPKAQIVALMERAL